MIDIDKLRQALGAVQPEEVGELLDRLEAAEKELTELRSSMKFRTSLIGRTEAERDELMAALQRIADRQEMSGTYTFGDDVFRYQKIARAAIARATGEQP